MKSTVTVERFSEDKLKLSESLRSILDLYNSMCSGEIKNSSAIYDITKESIVKILEKLYDRNCTFNDTTQMFAIHYSGKDSENRIHKTIIRNIQYRDHKQFDLFLRDMKNLATVIEKRQFVHLMLAGTEDYIKTDLTTTEEWENEKGKEKKNSVSVEKFYGPYRDDKRRGISFINKAVIQTFRKEERSGSIQNGTYRAQISNNRNYHVIAMTDFGDEILKTIGKYDKVKEVYTIPNVHSVVIDKFHQFAILVLVHFHLSFDNLERIKKCKFTKCSKLSFEKKKGSLKYCSKLCKKRYHDSAVPETKCRNRQNTWIRNQANKVIDGKFHLLYMDHCKGCIDYKKGGKCEILLSENGKIIENLRKSQDDKNATKMTF